MTQTARPISTISAGNWTPTGAPTLHEATDDVVANDLTDYAGVLETSSELFDVKFGPLSDPSLSTGHTFFIRFRDDLGYSWNFTVLQGAIIIAGWSDSSIVSTFKDTSYTLTGAETDSITNYSDLRMRSNVVGAGFGIQCYVTQIYMQIPDATPSTPPFYDVYLWNRPDE